MGIDRASHQPIQCAGKRVDVRPTGRRKPARTAKAKLSGHWVDRGENKTSNVVYEISDRELTEEEWMAKYCPESVADRNEPAH